MYAVVGVSAFFLYSIGPATPLIAADLGVSPAAAALHGTAVALAMMTTGWLAPVIIRRLGRALGLVATLLGLALAVAVVATAGSLAISLLGTYLAGCASQSAGVIGNSTLTDEHPDNAPAVLTEANAAAAWTGLLAPLSMGLFLSLGLGWRLGLAVAVPLCLVMIVVVRRAVPGDHGAVNVVEVVDTAELRDQPTVGEPRRAIPRIFWWTMAAVFAAAGVEFGINYWGATLMSEQVTSNRALVTALMSAPVGGVALGRTFGAALTARFASHTLLLGGFALSLVGFFIFWSGRVVWQAAAGLLVLGIGISVLFPLLLDRAVGFLPDRKDTALSLSVACAGTAIGAAPFALGAVAEHASTSTAFLIVPVLSLVGLVASARSRPVG